MGTTKKRGNGEGTIFQRKIKGKTYWIAEYTIAMYDKWKKKKKNNFRKNKTRSKKEIGKSYYRTKYRYLCR